MCTELGVLQEAERWCAYKENSESQLPVLRKSCTERPAPWPGDNTTVRKTIPLSLKCLTVSQALGIGSFCTHRAWDLLYTDKLSYESLPPQEDNMVSE